MNPWYGFASALRSSYDSPALHITLTSPRTQKNSNALADMRATAIIPMQHYSGNRAGTTEAMCLCNLMLTHTRSIRLSRTLLSCALVGLTIVHIPTTKTPLFAAYREKPRIHKEYKYIYRSIYIFQPGTNITRHATPRDPRRNEGAVIVQIYQTSHTTRHVDTIHSHCPIRIGELGPVV